MGDTYFCDSRDYATAVDAEVKCLNRFDTLKHLGFGHSFYEALSRITAFKQDTYGRELDMVVTFDVYDPRIGVLEKLALGTRISPQSANDPAEVTHFLCRSNGDALLTKVHVDYDFEIDAEEAKPSAHIQFGGRMNDRIRKACDIGGDVKIPWDEKVNKPRLPALPMNTALFWHAAFLEYQTPENAMITEILNSHSWNEIVKESETIVFGPFFRDGMDILSRDPSKGVLRCFYESVTR